MINGKHFKALFFSLCTSLMLSACSVQTKKLDVTPDIDNSFHQQGSLTTSAKWWLNFNDAQLEQLVDIGLKNNLSFTATLAKVNSAKASLGISEANLYPDLNFSSLLIGFNLRFYIGVVFIFLKLVVRYCCDF